MGVNIERALRLALYSRGELAKLRSDTGIQYDALTRGILHIFRNARDYREALPQAELMNRLGCVRRVVDAEACIDLEPALAGVRGRLVGGIFSPDDESGDAHAFTVRLAEICSGLGVVFRYGVRVGKPVTAAGRIEGVETNGGRLDSDAFVVALGSYSPPLLKPLGLDLPIYPAKGYSVTLPVADEGLAPMVSLIDDEFKMVYSRLGDRLRAAGTAEFAGYDDSINEVRGRFILGKALELFPGCGDAAEAQFWAGLRPSTPDGVPVVGETRYPNLFLNTGHGTLGWTMACGSGRLIADIVGGGLPEIPIDGLGIERFS
jgi:D-amino-acid dehydrogenase